MVLLALWQCIHSPTGRVKPPAPSPLQPVFWGTKRSSTSLVTRTFYFPGAPADMAAVLCSVCLLAHLLTEEAVGRTMGMADITVHLPDEEKRKEVGSGVPSG